MSAHIEVPLTQGLVALIDRDVAELVLPGRKWHAQQSRATFYARRRRAGGGMERMHTLITGWPLVDHISGNGLDNRRANLRPATPQENARNKRRASNNTSGFKGVSWHRHRGRWVAYITVGGRRFSLGYYDDPVEAAAAYDAAARELHGSFANLNLSGVS